MNDHVLGKPCKCGQRGSDDLWLCSRTRKSFVVQCKLCGEQWRTEAKYAQAIAMDYDNAPPARKAGGK